MNEGVEAAYTYTQSLLVQSTEGMANAHIVESVLESPKYMLRGFKA